MIFSYKNEIFLFVLVSCNICSPNESDINIYAGMNYDVGFNSNVINNGVNKFESEKKEFYQELTKSINSITHANCHVYLYCRRNTIFYSAISWLYVLEKWDLFKYDCKVVFIGEKGSDDGGLTREYLTLAIQKIYTRENAILYSPSGDTSKFIPLKISTNLDTKEKYIRRLAYKTLGFLIGLILRKSVTAEVRLDPIMWKIILEKDIFMDDLKNVDKSFSRALMDLNINLNHLKEMDLRFEDEEGNELMPNGKNIIVDETNVDEYIYLCLYDKYILKIREECDLIKEGIYKIIPKETLQKLSCDSLQKIIAGEPYIDIEDWRRNTIYHEGYDEHSLQIVAFWNVVESYTQEEKSKLLYFLTGSTRPPMGGFKHLRGKDSITQFKISPIPSYNDTKLPWTSSCYNNLHLPLYSTEEILREKLKKAVEFCGNEFEFS
ncbi:E3 ubiquitin-protein ligase [Vairimorpha necatrix]|uniref:HECT-type E3 ubiquitin transferase n=1 Tax=Vairimorpha necatrix TaxID=6039 RepID=A0AAX4JG05_9MICR